MPYTNPYSHISVSIIVWLIILTWGPGLLGALCTILFKSIRARLRAERRGRREWRREARRLRAELARLNHQ